VDNALQVYSEVRDTGLRYVGFKDIGLPFDQLKHLAAAIHATGQRVMLEVVSERNEDELRSARAALDLGVDYLLGGTHAEEVTEILAGSGIQYCPYPGRIVGHPSQLRGTIEDIVASARSLTALGGVHGLDLLAYRYDGDADAVVQRVVEAVPAPVIVAGSVDRPERIRRLTSLGAWGFTVGGAVFDRRFVAGGSIRDQVEAVLALSEGAPAQNCHTPSRDRPS
jgi:hypothetical protein